MIGDLKYPIFSLIVIILSAFLLGYINANNGGREGYYFSAAFVILGSLFMFFIDIHRRNLRIRKQQKHQRKQLLSENVSLAADGSIVHHGSGGLSGSNSGGVGGELMAESPLHESEHAKPLSFAENDEIFIPPAVAMLSHHSIVYDDDDDDIIDLKKPELTMYSEEGIADMDLPDNILLEDLDYLDNITSCNKVENCLMLSEYEQNLIKETEGPSVGGNSGHRRGRKWSLFRQPTLQTIHSEDEEFSMTMGVDKNGAHSATGAGVGGNTRSDKKHHCDGVNGDEDTDALKDHLGFNKANINKDGVREIPTFPSTSRRYPTSGPKRSITVIDEASV